MSANVYISECRVSTTCVLVIFVTPSPELARSFWLYIRLRSVLLVKHKCIRRENELTLSSHLRSFTRAELLVMRRISGGGDFA